METDKNLSLNIPYTFSYGHVKTHNRQKKKGPPRIVCHISLAVRISLVKLAWKAGRDGLPLTPNPFFYGTEIRKYPF
jgi:hypothetical protein